MRKSGFTLMEVLVALFFVSLGVALVAGLGQQVAQFARKSNQTGAILEIRSMASSITRSSESWLARMRSSGHTNGVFAGCIPDPKVNVSTFTCPAVDAGILAADTHLSEISGGFFHVASSPIVDNTGVKIAGTTDDPVYLTVDGRPCENSNAPNCAFKSTGYFMRSNSDDNEDPGNVKFVIKVEKNPLNVAGAPMKAQYMSIDIGQSWKTFNIEDKPCPKGAVKMGYLSSGDPYCVKAAAPCPANDEIAVGVSAAGATVCAKFPACATATDGVVLGADKKLSCSSSSSPCGAGKVFLGYFAGSGDPICTGLSMKCSSNQVQVGIVQTGTAISAECSSVPPCNDPLKKLIFDGKAFACSDASVIGMNCGPGELLTGITDGQPNCSRAPASLSGGCSVGQFIKKINPDGSFECADDMGGSSNTTTTTGGFAGLKCDPGFYLQGFNDDGSPDCMELPTGGDEISSITNNNVRSLGFSQPLPPNAEPASCLQNTTVNVIERSCTGFYYKCDYRTAPNTTTPGWYWVNNANNIYASCSSGITYAMTNVGTVESRIFAPLPNGVSPSTHEITCRYTSNPNHEYKCEKFVDTYSPPSGKVKTNTATTFSPTGANYNTVVGRIPLAKSAASLCYRAPYNGTLNGWIIMRKHPSDPNKPWAEIWCSSGIRAVKK